MPKILILVINPGSTSTKLSMFENQNEIYTETIHHDTDSLNSFSSIMDQQSFRYAIVKDFLVRNNIQIHKLSAVVGRGGLLKPIPSGTYRVNTIMIQDLKLATYGEHACNLGAILGDAISQEVHCPAYIVDPVVVDEMNPIARYSGHPMIQRKSIFHALNQKAVARQAANQLGKPYQDCQFIVAHLGGGISIGAHVKGQVVDVNNALDGEGPFSPERAGGVPAGDLISLCYSEQFDEKTIRKSLVGKGGLIAYIGTHDLREIQKKIEQGEPNVELVLKAMVYQICKEIGAMAAVMHGQIDAIVITGGIAYSNECVEAIKKQVSWISPIIVIPGEAEMDALAQGTFRVITGEEKEKEYV
ncbi:butyrate kinase [bacterium]